MNNRKKADVFIDGQNFFLSVKSHFGYNHPNFDVKKLIQSLANNIDADVGKIHFYTGMPGINESPFWHDYWSRRLQDMREQGIEVYNPDIKYRTRRERINDGSIKITTHGNEKGVDVKIAIDMFKTALKGSNLLIVLSQDNDLSVAVNEIQEFARENNKSIDVYSAYPESGFKPSKGILGTKLIPISKEFYDQNIESRDFRSPSMIRVHEMVDKQFTSSRQPEMYTSQKTSGSNIVSNTILHSRSPEENECFLEKAKIALDILNKTIHASKTNDINIGKP